MYQRFFGSDNPFWTAMGRLFDVVELNVLWLLCCLPIVTFGPATVGFYFAAISLVRGEETGVARDFFRAFRRDFRQSVIAGLIVLLIGAFLAADVYLAYRAGGGIYSFFMVFFFILALLWVFISLYVFPLLAKFENTLKATFIRAFTLAIRNLPTTLLMVIINVIALWLIHLLPGLVFGAFGVVMEVEATMLCAVFKPWLPPVGAPED